MLRLIKPLFWTFLFLGMLLAIDQLLVQIPPVHPAHAAVSNFYRDFRSRLIDLTFGEKQATPESIEAVIETQQKSQPGLSKNGKPAEQKPAWPASQPGDKPTQRYIYSDSRGELQFADSLGEVPVEFRAQAQPMAE